MAIYTRTGDKGETGLLGGKRVSKGNMQIHVLGTLDEVNSHLGLAVAMITGIEQAWNRLSVQKAEMLQRNVKLGNGFAKQEMLVQELGMARERLYVVQEVLFEMGNLVAEVGRREQGQISNQGSSANEQISKEEGRVSDFRFSTTDLELWIDEAEKDLPELKNFILPGGGVAGAQLMVARSVCRRAEREMVRWLDQRSRGQGEKLGDVWSDVSAYINRLSDWLFVLARRINWLLEEEERVWKKESLNSKS